MYMRIFQVKTNKALPAMGSILIASPLLSDYHFARTVILMVTHNEEGSMGIVMNQMFHHDITLNELIPGLDSVPGIPVFKGGPIGRDTIFFIHTITALEGALKLNNALYLNGNFGELKQYILQGNPVEGHIRFFAGYAGWSNGQLQREIQENSWMVGKSHSDQLLDYHNAKLWNDSMNGLGQKYSLWAKYPIYPSFN